jgi:hypothetical protein
MNTPSHIRHVGKSHRCGAGGTSPATFIPAALTVTKSDVSSTKVHVA